MTVDRIELSAEADARIRALATAAYPNEGCGALIGKVADGCVGVVLAQSGTNLNTDRSRDRYLLDPGDIVRADHEARALGMDVVGFWHSHPDHPAQPSRFDTDHAWVDYLYVIVNTTAGGAGDLNGFSLLDDGGSFDQLPLAVMPDAGSER